MNPEAESNDPRATRTLLVLGAAGILGALAIMFVLQPAADSRAQRNLKRSAAQAKLDIHRPRRRGNRMPQDQVQPGPDRLRVSVQPRRRTALPHESGGE